MYSGATGRLLQAGQRAWIALCLCIPERSRDRLRWHATYEGYCEPSKTPDADDRDPDRAQSSVASLALRFNFALPPFELHKARPTARRHRLMDDSAAIAPANWPLRKRAVAPS